MGVNGLSTYVNRRKDKLLAKRKLRKCTLVIDGNSLCAQLAKIGGCARAALGGDYVHYAERVSHFYELLRRCSIRAVVLMDGCYEAGKIRTVLSRVSSRLREAVTITPRSEKEGASVLFPALLRDTFVQVTLREGIPLYCCPLEADPLLSSLAKRLRCPLLSLDSDFFISEVEYVPFDELERKISSDREGNYLSCRVCPAGAFASSLGLKPKCLPILATLLGNDRVKRSAFSKFFRGVEVADGGKGDLGKRRVAGLVRWLRNETAESAIEKVLGRYRKECRDRVARKIERSLEVYSAEDADFPEGFEILLDALPRGASPVETTSPPICEDVDEPLEENEIFADEEADDAGESASDSDGEEDYRIFDRQFPRWARDSLAAGFVSPRLFDLVRGSFYLGNPQVEDFSKPDSFVCAFPLLRFAHSLIVCDFDTDIRYEGRRDRARASLTIPPGRDLGAREFVDRPPSSLFLRFLDDFGVEKGFFDFVTRFPPDSQLFLLAILWIKKSSDCALVPSEVYALLLCLLNFGLIAKKVGERCLRKLQRKYSKEIDGRRDAKRTLQTITSVEDYPKEDDVDVDDAIFSALLLFKFSDMSDDVLSPKLYKRQRLHVFAQFQNCLQQLGYLNALFGNPLKPCNYGDVYSGTFVYNMHANLVKRDYPGSYVFQLLEKTPSVLKYFIILCRAIGFDDCISPNSVVRMTKNKKRKRKKNTTLTDDASDESAASNSDGEENSVLNDINNRFSILSVS